MRIADNMTFDQVKNNLQKNRSEMSDLQNQAATLKRVTKPSDDPLAATRVLSYRTETQSNNQFLNVGTQAKSLLDFSDQSLGELANVIMRTKELVLSQANDASGNEDSRRVVAEEVAQLKRQAVQVANRKLGERYLFGGYQTVESPFSFDGEYRGDDGEIRMPVNKDTWIAVNIPGSKVFLGKQTLDHQLNVEDESVVEPRTVDELQKAEQHQAQIQQKEQEKEGQRVEVRGPASVPFAPQPNEEGGSNPTLSLRKEGVNIFEVLKKVHISMKANDKNGLQDTIEDLDEALKQVVLARAEIGARVSTLDANSDSLSRMKIDAKEVSSQLEDADQFAVISDITKSDQTLKATLQTSGKLIQPSLLDFLR